MTYLKFAVFFILAALGLAAGAAKMMQMPQEVAFFAASGLSTAPLVVFGAAQLIGGIFMIFRSYRFWGALILALTFAFSTAMLYRHGTAAMTLVSALSVVVALWAAFVARRK